MINAILVSSNLLSHYGYTCTIRTSNCNMRVHTCSTRHNVSSNLSMGQEVYLCKYICSNHYMHIRTPTTVCMYDILQPTITCIPLWLKISTRIFKTLEEPSVLDLCVKKK